MVWNLCRLEHAEKQEKEKNYDFFSLNVFIGEAFILLLIQVLFTFFLIPNSLLLKIFLKF